MRTFFIGIVLFFSTAVLAQTKGNQIKKDSLDAISKMVGFIADYDVISDIDTLIFSKEEKNFYSSGNNIAGYMQNMMPMSFEKSKESFLEKMFSSKKADVERKEFIHNGQKVFYVKMLDKKDEEELISLVFIKEYENISIVIFGYYKEKYESKFLKPITESALSATLIKKNK